MAVCRKNVLPGQRAARKPCANTNTPEAKGATCATRSTRTGSKEEARYEKGKRRSRRCGGARTVAYSGPKNHRADGRGPGDLGMSREADVEEMWAAAERRERGRG